MGKVGTGEGLAHGAHGAHGAIDSEKPAPILMRASLHEMRVEKSNALLDGDRQIHVRVNGSGDFIRPRLVECNSGGVAWIGRETWVGEFLRGIGVGDALAIIARADDVQATGI